MTYPALPTQPLLYGISHELGLGERDVLYVLTDLREGGAVAGDGPTISGLIYGGWSAAGALVPLKYGDWDDVATTLDVEQGNWAG